MRITTGYFGRVGDDPKVHIVTAGRPACGSKHHPDASYHFCAYGIRREYLTCDRCMKRAPT